MYFQVKFFFGWKWKNYFSQKMKKNENLKKMMKKNEYWKFDRRWNSWRRNFFLFTPRSLGLFLILQKKNEWKKKLFFTTLNNKVKLGKLLRILFWWRIWILKNFRFQQIRTNHWIIGLGEGCSINVLNLSRILFSILFCFIYCWSPIFHSLASSSFFKIPPFQLSLISP